MRDQSVRAAPKSQELQTLPSRWLGVSEELPPATALPARCVRAAGCSFSPGLKVHTVCDGRLLPAPPNINPSVLT